MNKKNKKKFAMNKRLGTKSKSVVRLALQQYKPMHVLLHSYLDQ